MEQALQNILSKIKPEREDWAVRFDIINDVRDAVQTVESLRGIKRLLQAVAHSHSIFILYS